MFLRVMTSILVQTPIIILAIVAVAGPSIAAKAVKSAGSDEVLAAVDDGGTVSVESAQPEKLIVRYRGDGRFDLVRVNPDGTQSLLIGGGTGLVEIVDLPGEPAGECKAGGCVVEDGKLKKAKKEK